MKNHRKIISCKLFFETQFSSWFKTNRVQRHLIPIMIFFLKIMEICKAYFAKIPTATAQLLISQTFSRTASRASDFRAHAYAHIHLCPSPLCLLSPPTHTHTHFLCASQGSIFKQSKSVVVRPQRIASRHCPLITIGCDMRKHRRLTFLCIGSRIDGGGVFVCTHITAETLTICNIYPGAEKHSETFHIECFICDRMTSQQSVALIEKS